MAFEKINSANMRKNNYKAVLDIVRFSSGISRKAIAQKIGLTGATITNIVADLIKEGYVREIGEVKSTSGGRKEIMLAINPGMCYAIGVELSASVINCVLTDFAAQILVQKVVKIKYIVQDRDAIIDSLIQTIEDVIQEAGIPRKKIRGIGLSTPGPCDTNNGVLINPPNLQCLWDTPIRDIVCDRVKIPVLFEHHMNAAVLCEQWLGRACDSECMFLCAVLETGVAGGMLIDGKLHRGFKNTAGEIGHMCVDSNGPKCVCGNYGCLEPLAQGRALMDSIKTQFSENPVLMEKYGISDIEEIDIDFVINHAEKGDTLFRNEVLLRAGYVGRALCNITSVISPDTIVLMGELADKSPLYVDAVARCIHEHAYPSHMHHIHVYATEFKRFVCALGGVAMVLGGIYEDL